MDLNKLRTFVVVAQAGSITVAAERLYRTQPAISNQLKDLEAELKLTLFERRNARIFLTREGERLFHIAQDLIGQLDDTALRLRSNQNDTEGLIRVSADYAAGGHLLPTMISQFRRRFPRVRFELVSGRYDEIETLLLTNKVDFAFMVFRYQPEFIHYQSLFHFTRSLVAAQSYLLGRAPIRALEDLLGLEYVSFINRSGDLRNWLKVNGRASAIARFDQNPAPVIVQDSHLVNEMILAGVGAGFVFDEPLGPAAFDAHRLVTLLPDYQPIGYTVDLAYRKVRNEAYLLQCFREFVLENAQAWHRFSASG